MPKYHDKCPNCGNRLENVCTWDIVTEQYCDSDDNGCGWYKVYGYVSGPAGSHYLVTYDNDEEESIIISFYSQN